MRRGAFLNVQESERGHMDRHDCYERCVQSPADLVPFLRALHAGTPTLLREDFCGTGAISRFWTALVPGGSAVATDLDDQTLAEARRRAGAGHPIEFRRCDAIAATDADPADVIFVGNFSIGYIHDRATLVRYLERSRQRLRPGGVFVCDTYGGAASFTIGATERTHHAPDGAVIRYLWRQDHADPLTNLVRTSLHFRVLQGSEVVADFPDAFSYHWRLWSIAELREAMREVGFASSAVHAQISPATSGRPVPVTVPAELGPTWFVCIAARE